MNLAVARYTPKTRCYSMTMSLQNRVSIAVGLANGGYDSFWRDVFQRCGLCVPPKMAEYLKEKDIATAKKEH